MSIGMRIFNILWGIIMLVSAALLFYDGREGYQFLVAVISTSFMVKGIKRLVYYFSMGRYMVGGRELMTKAIVSLSFAYFVWNLTDVPRIYIGIYISLGLAFAGIVSLLRSIEMKRQVNDRYKYKLVQGIFILLMAVTSLVFHSSSQILVYIYGIGLIVSAVNKITEAFRKSAIIYIS